MKTINAALSIAVLALLSLLMSNKALADIPPDNVQGDWTIYSTNVGNGDTVVKHIQIAQYGDRITGYFEGPVQSGPIQGEIKGHNIRFNTVTRNVLHFSGQIYGDQMSGTYGIRGKHAPWQAVRASMPTAAVPSTGTVYQSQPVLIPTESQTSYQYPNPAVAAAPQSEPQPATSYAAQTGTQPTATSQPTPAPLSADQLDSMVAPIALYPDALVAQVLAAATNPEQVAYADDWLQQNKSLTGSALEQAVDQQAWDPSVKALTQFPSVLDNLAHNLSWTSSLGQAFANQQNDVMAAVQAMRAKAHAAGTLQSNSQITITQPTPTTIVIQPANPQIIYVPQYNPAIVFGAPVVVPLYIPPPMPVASIGLYFGSGITIGAVFGGGGWGGGLGWGWHAWGVNWGCCGGGGSTTIIYNHNTYINNHTWNNTHYNGYHPWGGSSGTHPNGGANGNHGLIGGNGGVQHTSGFAPNQPNGGQNGNHGLIGGNGGVQHTSSGWNNSGSHFAQNRPQDGHFAGAEQNRSRFSGNGASNRAESNRGWNSMAGRRSQPRMAREHMPAAHSFGGGRRR